MAPLLEATTDIGAVEIMIHPGATILEAADRSLSAANKCLDLIVVMAGICSITKKDQRTKMISLRYTTLGSVVEAVMDDIVKAHAHICRVTTTPISFATITGADLTDVNNKHRKRMTTLEYRNYVDCYKKVHTEQPLLDAAVHLVNKQITAFNNKNGTPTTWMAEVVHPYLRGKHRSYYTRLADGCHPTDNTRKRWAHQIARVIRRAEAMTTNEAK